ncbi:MAG: hypothetical protein JSU96_14705 [Acidobacteriota bacterium]|nr:MAG: hypothetical protein JSU96_14705 [Acidobacteriota bacterium]
MANIELSYDFDLPAAKQRLDRVQERNPSSAEAALNMESYYWFSGRWDEAIEVNRKARELDPLNHFLEEELGLINFHGRRYGEATRILEGVREIQPNSVPANFGLPLAYAAWGRHPQAVKACETALEILGDTFESNIYGACGYAFARSGQEERAREILDRMIEAQRERYVPPVWPATVYAGLGETDKAFEWLETCLEVRSPNLLFLISGAPQFDSLRSDARFDDLLRRAGVRGS